MKTKAILLYQWKDLIRGKWLPAYAMIYLMIAEALIRFGGGGPRSMLSIANIMLLLVPLVSMVYGAMYLYQSREFTELLMAQPVDRKTLFRGLYGGISIPMTAAFLTGFSLPVIWHGLLFNGHFQSYAVIAGLGSILTMLFTGLGFRFGLMNYDDRVRGLGFALIGWLLLGILYDGIVLMLVFMLGDYPIEKPMLAVTLLNPLDLARIIVLLKFDISALMGYTGAVFTRYFGSYIGILVSVISLSAWTVLPFISSRRSFERKDL